MVDSNFKNTHKTRMTAEFVCRMFKSANGTSANQHDLALLFERARDQNCAVHVDPMSHQFIRGQLATLMGIEGDLGEHQISLLQGVPICTDPKCPVTEFWVVPVAKKLPWMERWRILDNGTVFRIERIERTSGT